MNISHKKVRFSEEIIWVSMQHSNGDTSVQLKHFTKLKNPPPYEKKYK